MSRSRKKHPIVKTPRGPTKISKRLAAKVARNVELSNGCGYKKVFSSYNIWDLRSNLYQSYHADGHAKRRYFAELTDELLRAYWNK